MIGEIKMENKELVEIRKYLFGKKSNLVRAAAQLQGLYSDKLGRWNSSYSDSLYRSAGYVRDELYSKLESGDRVSKEDWSKLEKVAVQLEASLKSDEERYADERREFQQGQAEEEFYERHGGYNQGFCEPKGLD